jgi:hypothetical protein
LRSARLKCLGGLGILHLGKFARALRLRWLWRQWSPSTDGRLGNETPCNTTDKLLFAASTVLTIGDGKKASFWTSAWLDGQRPCDVAPCLFSTSKRKNRTLHQAITDNNWIRDINLQHYGLSAQHLAEYTHLWHEVRCIVIRVGMPDNLSWKFKENGKYTTSSAYHAKFVGTTYNNFEALIWKPWAPPKCKFFSWLAIQNRVWTADRLEARRWPNQGTCTLCRLHAETCLHLFMDCKFTKRLWKEIATWTQIYSLHPSAWPPSETLEKWWTTMSNAPGASRKGICSLIILVCWEVWNERNARVFDHTESTNFVVL